MAAIATIAKNVNCSEQLVRNLKKLRKTNGLYVTTEHSGKMSGTMSLSTSCDINPLCLARMKNGNSICSKCFSHRQWSRYSDKSSEPFKRNYYILNEHGNVFPTFSLGNAKYFRGESFGDSASWKHPAYFIRLAVANPGTQIALWTKNPWFVREAVEKLGMKRKPSNLQIILSSLEINKPDRKLAEEYSDVVNKLFTVYSKDFLAEHPEVKINCGALNCHYQCGYKCYKRWHEKGIREINEEEK